MGAVVLFDGVCNFCDSFVNSIIERDKEGYFKFAPLQSETGSRLAREHGLSSALDPESSRSSDGQILIDSIILIEDGKAYTHSEAALRIMKRLGWYGWLVEIALVVPIVIRDAFYRIFTRYRYLMFGKKSQCMIPTPEVRERFLR